MSRRTHSPAEGGEMANVYSLLGSNCVMAVVLSGLPPSKGAVQMKGHTELQHHTQSGCVSEPWAGKSPLWAW